MNEEKKVTLEDIVSLAKRRGFIYQSSDIYGGLAGFYDYGPLGSLLKNNIRDSWIDAMVAEEENMYLIDSTILFHEKVWETTGHVKLFNDPLVVDLETHKRYRADHILEEHGIDPKGMSIEEMSQMIFSKSIKSPEGNELSDVKDFNMMLSTQLGADGAMSMRAYLRPETAQGIFLNFKNVVDSFHPKLPFGIAQVGKAFRNEITPRNFLFRVREMEQMEVEYFTSKEHWKRDFEFWLKKLHAWSISIGIDNSKVINHEIAKEDLAHYSERTIDLEFEFPFGQKELFGLAYRTDYDLRMHDEATGKKIGYVDQDNGEYILPHVIEPSVGLDRSVLAVLCSCYKTDMMGDSERIYLTLPPSIAPYKIAVFPLVKNKEHITAKAREVFESLKKEFKWVIWDDNGNVGKRYRRQDEIGTPYCIVVDYDSLDDQHVTIRMRDSGEQVRIMISELSMWFREHLHN